MDHVELIPETYTFSEVTDSEQCIPRILHMIWVGDAERPIYVDVYTAQWQALMPEWQVRLWTNDDITEAEFSAHIVAKINQCEKGAQKADLMRYFIMYKYGGVYMDTDVIPHRSLEPIVRMGRQVVLCHDLPVTWPYISIGFFAAAPRNPLFDYACTICNGTTINGHIPMETGPRLLGEAVWKVTPTEKYAVLHMYYFYRNLAGNQITDTDYRDDDFANRFGAHFYAKQW